MSFCTFLIDKEIWEIEFLMLKFIEYNTNGIKLTLKC